MGDSPGALYLSPALPPAPSLSSSSSSPQEPMAPLRGTVEHVSTVTKRAEGFVHRSPGLTAGQGPGGKEWEGGALRQRGRGGGDVALSLAATTGWGGGGTVLLQP